MLEGIQFTYPGLYVDVNSGFVLVNEVKYFYLFIKEFFETIDES